MNEIETFKKTGTGIPTSRYELLQDFMPVLEDISKPDYLNIQLKPFRFGTCDVENPTIFKESKILLDNIEKGSSINEFKEWIIAVRIERQYSKKEIISMYLNRFDFLNLAVGIKSASKIYFNSTPQNLTIEQAATLIGKSKNPSL